MPHDHQVATEPDWNCLRCIVEMEEAEKYDKKMFAEWCEMMAKDDPNYRPGNQEDYDVEDGRRERREFYRNRDYRFDSVERNQQ